MTPDTSSRTAELCARAPVIPVLTVAEVAHARPLAEALVAGGLPVIEVTLRTEAALEAIRAMGAVSGAVVGAGTLVTAGDVRSAMAAGAEFGVSPGATPALLDAVEAEALPFLPGAATVSESMVLQERGYGVQKFFPAKTAGGPSALKAIGAPLPGIRFCPTGGVTPENAPEYLRLDNVLCVGGSWIAPADKLVAGDWAGIEALAREAAALGR